MDWKEMVFVAVGVVAATEAQRQFGSRPVWVAMAVFLVRA
jgi:hypothetical protein